MYQTDIISSIEKSMIAIAICVGFTFLYFIVLKIGERVFHTKITNAAQLYLTAFVFGLLALVIGIITGASRSAAIGDVLPAALSLIGAVTLFIITRAKTEFPLAMTAVVSFSTLLLLGVILGSYERVRSVAYKDSLEYDFKLLKTRADIEFVINGYRKSRGLSPITLSRCHSLPPS